MKTTDEHNIIEGNRRNSNYEQKTLCNVVLAIYIIVFSIKYQILHCLLYDPNCVSCRSLIQ